MSFTLDQYGNAVTEPFQSISEVLQWMPNSFSCSSPQLPHQVPPSELDFDVPVKLRQRPSRPQLLVCHDMCGGYLDDRFSHGCCKSSAYKFYHWQFIDIFIYFSHKFVTIPPIGWIKAARKHGVIILGTIITEWDDGVEICREILKSEDTIDQFTTKLAQVALFHGFHGWLINIENKIETDQVTSLHKFVEQLTIKCRQLLGVSKVLWYDSVISNGELNWQNELNSLNKMFFMVSDGIYLNYNINEEKLSQSSQVACALGRQLDVFVGIDIFGRGTPGGGGFNTVEPLKMILNHGLSCAMFAPGWVYEHLGPDKFDSNELMFWGILSEMLAPRPVEVPFTTSFCRGSGERYYMQGQVLTDTPWYNLGLQQVQPSFTQSQFVSYTVSKVTEPEEEGQEKFGIEVDSQENHLAHPEMVFDSNVGYVGGGSLRLTARRIESVSVMFKIFVLSVLPDISLCLSVTWKVPSNSSCVIGFVLSSGTACQPGQASTVICTETDLIDKHREMIQNMVLEPTDISVKKSISTSVHFVTAAKEDQDFTNDTEWRTCVFNVDTRLLSRDSCQGQELILSAVLIPHSESTEDEPESSRDMCVHIGYLQIVKAASSQEQTQFLPGKNEPFVKNLKCLEVKVGSLLSRENVNQILMHPCFGSADDHLVETNGATKNISHVKDTSAVDVISEDEQRNKSSDSSSHTIPLTVFRHKIDLTSALAASLESTQFTLYILKWEALAGEAYVCMVYSHHESGVTSFIGHAVDNWFVWKQVNQDETVQKFTVLPVVIFKPGNRMYVNLRALQFWR